MVRLARTVLVVLALLVCAPPVVFAAPSAEERAFGLATNKFQHLSPDLSEQDFADFVKKYPTSIRVPEAILYEAKAMLYSGQANGAIDLLTTNHAGTLAPQYLYWLGRAHFQNKNYTNAANTFAEMVQKYRGSQDALDATVREANAYARMEQWPQLEKLLTDTNELFQSTVRERARAHANAVSETIAAGFLLLGEAQLAQGKFSGAENTLHALETQALDTPLKWQRDYLASRVQRAQGRLEDVLAERKPPCWSRRTVRTARKRWFLWAACWSNWGISTRRQTCIQTTCRSECRPNNSVAPF